MPIQHKKRIISIAGVAVLLLIIALGMLVLQRYHSPVPSAVSKAVTFPIYFPEQKKLPTGYTLVTSSFQAPQKDAVLYYVAYGHNQKIVFSVQPKVSAEELQTFYDTYLPLRNDYSTPIGQAEIGAYNTKNTLQTLVSLQTNDKTWLIITAPKDVQQNQLKQVLNSLKK